MLAILYHGLLLVTYLSSTTATVLPHIKLNLSNKQRREILPHIKTLPGGGGCYGNGRDMYNLKKTHLLLVVTTLGLVLTIFNNGEAYLTFKSSSHNALYLF